MNTVMLFRFAHFLGVILWIGGVTAVAFAAASAAGSASKETAASLRSAALKIATPGMILAWIGGLAMLVPHFMSLYARAGWMHGKLTLVVIASALSGVISGKLRKAASGQAPLDPGKLRGLGIVMVITAILVVFLATMRPGS